jgi:5-methylcytosine-specific restriction endonuclease McrA
MNHSLPKRQRTRLAAQAYRALHRKILERDGWKCQACGFICNLEVHHMQRRSHLGDDSAENLITLCSHCHRTIHA